MGKQSRRKPNPLARLRMEVETARQFAEYRAQGIEPRVLTRHDRWDDPEYFARYRADDYRVRWRDRDTAEVLVGGEADPVAFVFLDERCRPHACIPEGIAGTAHADRVFRVLLEAMVARGVIKRERWEEARRRREARAEGTSPSASEP
ncbi:MAG TPA: hypothetical protein VFL91_24010 [Thermomicrobiales bacterium]|nr:hypothetical protein [Thermomicrobiales bacterium]